MRLFLQDCAEALRRRLGYLLFPPAAGFALAVVIAFLLPPEFESTTAVATRSTPRPAGSESVALLSEPFAALREALFDSTTFRRAKEDPAVAGRSVTIDHGGEGVVHIRVKDADPERARRRAGLLTDLAVQRAAATDSARLDEAIAAYERQAVLPVSPRRDTAGIAPAATPPDEARNLRERLADASARLASAETRLAAAVREDSLAGFLLAEVDDPAVVARLAAGGLPPGMPGREAVQASAERTAGLLRRYTDRHPEVQSARAGLRGALSRGSAVLGRRREEAAAERDRLVSQRDELRTRLAAIPASMPAAAEPAIVSEAAPPPELGRLKVLRDILGRSGPRFVVLRQADLPLEPASPRRAFIIGGGAAAGLLLGLLGVLLAEAFDPTIRRAKDLEVFRKPVIASIP